VDERKARRRKDKGERKSIRFEIERDDGKNVVGLIFGNDVVWDPSSFPDSGGRVL